MVHAESGINMNFEIYHVSVGGNSMPMMFSFTSHNSQDLALQF